MKTTCEQKLTSLLLVIGAGFLSGCGEQAAEAPTPAALMATTAAGPGTVLTTLKSRWLRPDGGYILEIRSVDDASGKLEAAYLNPRSINVSKAQAWRDGASLKVFIELRDINYPGSTYTLAYDPASDQLQGNYYQALQEQSFDVVFTRVKP